MSLQNTVAATAITLGGIAFLTATAAGLGLGLAVVGTACVARRRMRRYCEARGQAGHDNHAEIAASLASEAELPLGSAKPG